MYWPSNATLGVQAVTDRQGTAGVIAVGRIGKRGVGAKADTREINAARRPTSRVRRGLSADSRILGERGSSAVTLPRRLVECFSSALPRLSGLGYRLLRQAREVLSLPREIFKLLACMRGREFKEC